ncbi:hypothetical protein SAMN05216387_10893 [Nitrosovibrio tenuis]|uniref:Uncharacterized protein n=2 Tax=Nitrosovibrio tenuis TaxID=1233 RepID=A0A1H7P8M5_9PROT|nr:hypothetical protein SAMN05216387_10893 [Nitrosovibrio tenuis]
MAAGNPYAGVISILNRYWTIYGGIRALITSPYAHFALLLSILTGDFWLHHEWWDQPIIVLPNLLGFTLGGFAVFVSFGDEKFKALIAGNDPNGNGRNSPYLNISVTLLHFVLFQLIALVWAVVTNALHFDAPAWLDCCSHVFLRLEPIGNGIGYWLFLYSICTAVAAALNIFRLTFIFDAFVTRSKQDNKDQ